MNLNAIRPGLRYLLVRAVPAVGVLCASVDLRAAISIVKTNYHGWADSYILANGIAEVVVVPVIGRVMQFRVAGDAEGAFWENRALDGKAPTPASKDWGNFGGDKTWPAPQADWPKVTPRSWPPPVAFDSMPVEARVEGDKLRLVSPVDPHYGIRTERVVTLAAAAPQLTIETTYFKTEGRPRKVGVWIITQLSEPEDVCLRVKQDKYVKQSDDLPLDLKFEKDGLHLKRSRSKSTKIGTTASVLEWRNRRLMLTIESPRIPGAEYPDEGSSAEVYTNPDPLPYVELEMLGPLKMMNVGDAIAQTNTYTLRRVGGAVE